MSGKRSSPSQPRRAIAQPPALVAFPDREATRAITRAKFPPDAFAASNYLPSLGPQDLLAGVRASLETSPDTWAAPLSEAGARDASILA